MAEGGSTLLFILLAATAIGLAATRRYRDRKFATPQI
jgi:hypothetical protein